MTTAHARRNWTQTGGYVTTYRVFGKARIACSDARHGAGECDLSDSRFATAMKHLLQFVLILFVIWPLLTLWHELGHALVPLWAGRSPVRIRLGTGRLGCTVQFGRLGLRIAPVPLGFGWCEWTPPADRAWAMAAHLLGPCASAAAAGGLWLLARGAAGLVHELALAGAAIAFMQCMFTAVPMRYPRWFGPYAGQPSDGLRAWTLATSSS